MSYTHAPIASPTTESNWLLSKSVWDVWSPAWVLDPGVITYSFPDTVGDYEKNHSGFQAFSDQQKTAFYGIFDTIEALTNIDLVEIKSNGSYGDVDGNYAFTHTPGRDGDAILRYAMTSKAGPDASFTYLPSEKPEGGDSWFGNKGSTFNGTAVPGTYAYTVLLHEIGHSFGLEHSFDAGPYGPVPASMDSLEYTVMSYSADVGGPSWSATTGPVAGNYPQTYMMLDLASLQSQYGADFSTNSGDTVYKWDSVTGAMSVNNTVTHDAPGSKIFMTMWDGGGNDTYDASNYSNGVTIDLRPGGWTTLSTSQLADLDAKTAGLQGAAGNIANSLYISGTGADGNPTDNLIENAIGGSGIDHITGNDAANHLTGGGGADQLAGGKGADAFIYTNENDSTGVQADTILDLDHFDFIDMGKVDANRNSTGNQDFTWHDGLTSYNDLAIGEIGFVENADHSGGLLLAKVAADAGVDFAVHISFAEPLAFGSAFIHQDALLA